MSQARSHTTSTSPKPSPGPDIGVSSHSAHVSGAWRSPRAWFVLIVSILLSLAIDLGSKSWAFERVASTPVTVLRERVLEVTRTIDARAISQEIVPPHSPMVVVPELLNFTLVLNPGAVFGMGPGKRAFFMAFTLVALGFGLFMFSRWTGPRDAWAHVAVGMLLGGGLGNLYDRLTFACVRDFIHPLPGWKWPGGFKPFGDGSIWPYVSNLADLFLLVGIVMLLVHLWRKDRRVAE